MLNQKTGSSDMERYVIKTALVSKPDVVFYFRGTANEEGVSYAMNTIVGFDVSEAMVFHNKDEALQLCEKLNQDKEILLMYGFEPFETISL
jgi:hypothetical protein